MREDADSNLNLGSTLRTRRRALKLTQEDLSDIAGVSLRLVHEIEHGKESVQLATLIKILSSLGLHLDLTLGPTKAITINPAIAQLMREKK